MKVYTDQTGDITFWEFHNESKIQWDLPQEGWITITPPDEPSSVFNVEHVVCLVPDHVEPM